MNSCDTLESICEINLSYLMLAQKMLREERDVAIVRLCLSEHLADVLTAMSPTQTMALAACGQLLCLFSFSGQAMLEVLMPPGKTDRVDQITTVPQPSSDR